MTTAQISRPTLKVQFNRTVTITYDWEDAPEFTNARTGIKARATSVRITYFWADDAGWVAQPRWDVTVRGARVKKNGDAYDEKTSIEYDYPGVTAFRAALVDEHRPTTRITWTEE